MGGESVEMFENDVKMYGIQTNYREELEEYRFENDVKMYGIQTAPKEETASDGLRMM